MKKKTRTYQNPVHGGTSTLQHLRPNTTLILPPYKSLIQRKENTLYSKPTFITSSFLAGNVKTGSHQNREKLSNPLSQQALFFFTTTDTIVSSWGTRTYFRVIDRNYKHRNRIDWVGTNPQFNTRANLRQQPATTLQCCLNQNPPTLQHRNLLNMFLPKTWAKQSTKQIGFEVEYKTKKSMHQQFQLHTVLDTRTQLIQHPFTEQIL